MDFAFYYTAALLVIMTVLLIKEWLEVELTMFCVLLLLIAARVITLEEAFAGFSNEAMLSVGLLYIVAGALENTGALKQGRTLCPRQRPGCNTLKTAASHGPGCRSFSIHKQYPAGCDGHSGYPFMG